MEEDVHEIMGFPLGGVDVGFVENNHLKKVGRKFSGEQDNVIKSRLSNFASLLFQNNAADNQFKMNFMVLMSNVLIELGSSTLKGYLRY